VRSKFLHVFQPFSPLENRCNQSGALRAGRCLRRFACRAKTVVKLPKINARLRARPDNAPRAGIDGILSHVHRHVKMECELFFTTASTGREMAND
jgi:hypothetical protein